MMTRYTVTIEDREYDIELEYHADHLAVRVDGNPRQVQVHALQDTRALLLVDGESHEVDIHSVGPTGDTVIFMQGMEIPVTVENYNLAQMRKTAGITSGAKAERFFKAPMPGLVVTVKVEPGQAVKAGQPMVVVEAMKMENILKATTDGVVKEILVGAGQSVEKGDRLLEFE
jgi:biotin carboxyl carrier protein